MATDTAGQKEQTAVYPMVVLFELESLALAGRKRLYDLLKKALAAVEEQAARVADAA